jgi:hypothetical protein
MNTTKRFSLLVLLISTTLTSLSLYAGSLMLGTIRFPSSIKTVPTVRIYCGGRIIPCTIDQQNKTVSFNIPKYGQQFHFNLLIAEKISFAQANSKYQTENTNTAAYLKLETGQPYKLYSLLLVPEFSDDSKDAQLRYRWHIKNESIVHQDLKIPDDAIIVCYNPEWVADLQGFNAFELPTIEITPNILSLCGSEQSFQSRSAQIMLASLDTDTLHATQSKQSILLNDNRITIAAPAA